MEHKEDDLQMACVRWFDLQFSVLSWALFHVPNGGFRNRHEAARFKAMGVRSGVPDLLLLIPCRKVATPLSTGETYDLLFNSKICKSHLWDYTVLSEAV